MMSLVVTGRESWPGVEVRWLDVSADLDPGDGCAERARALVATASGFDLWVCCGLGPADGDWDSLDELRDVKGETAVARAAAVFGVPWGSLSESVMRAQLVLLQGAEESLMERVREASPDQLLALRQHVFGGRPGDMVRVLRVLRDYAAVTQ